MLISFHQEKKRHPLKIISACLLLTVCFYPPAGFAGPSEIDFLSNSLQPGKPADAQGFLSSETPMENDPTTNFFNGAGLSLAELQPLNFLPDSIPIPDSGIVSVPPMDPSDPAGITKVPQTALNQSPKIFGVVNPDHPEKNDFSSLDIRQPTKTRVEANVRLFNNDSTAGIFIDYDNPKTVLKESINLSTAFPDGIVLGLDNGGTATSESRFVTIDTEGRASFLRLSGIESAPRLWRINLALLGGTQEPADLTQITRMGLILDGRLVDSQLNVEWGDFLRVSDIQSTPSTPSIPTPLPLLADGEKVKLTSSDSNHPADGDWSDAELRSLGPQEAELRFNTFNEDSYAMLSARYDLSETTAKETINLAQLFPDGIVLGLRDDGDAPLQEITLTVTDDAERDASVKFLGVDSLRRFFKISLSSLEEVDLTKIIQMDIRHTGRAVGARLNVHLGDFAHEPSLQGNANPPASFVLLPRDANGTKPALTGESSFDISQPSFKDWSSEQLTVESTNKAQWDLRLFNEASFARASILYDTLATPAGTIHFENVFGASGLVLGLDNGGIGDVTEAYFEVLDSQGRQETVKLSAFAATAPALCP